MADAEGGTKIQRRNVQQIPQNGGPVTGPSASPQQMDQEYQQQMEQEYHQQQMAQVYQQKMAQQQMGQQQIPQRQMQQRQMGNMGGNYACPPKKKFNFSFENKNMKNSLLVVVIFIVLNSKMIWRIISKMPMMGTVEPSILALIVNSIIAGLAFYLLSSKLNKF
jgi:hypothetical protein